MRRILDSVRFHHTNEVWDTRTSTSQKLRRRIAFSSALAGNENRTSSPLVVSMTAGYESEIREQERLKRKLPNQRKHAVDTGHLS